MSKPQAAEYGLQSMRSGGDTWLYEKGASQAVRMAVGDWKTPGVEASYRACNYRRRMQMAAGFQL